MTDTDSSKFIIPDVGEKAKMRMIEWEKMSKPAFVRVHQQDNENSKSCKNCAGMGLIYISFCAGRANDTPEDKKRPHTWFDGNEKYFKGWYAIENTLGFPCVKCSGRGY